MKHCSAFGKTPEEALAEVLKAKEAWLEATLSSGKTIPAPRYHPLIYIERGISRKIVKKILLSGEIIENYPDDKPYPSALFLGCSQCGADWIADAIAAKLEKIVNDARRKHHIVEVTTLPT